MDIMEAASRAERAEAQAAPDAGRACPPAVERPAFLDAPAGAAGARPDGQAGASGGVAAHAAQGRTAAGPKDGAPGASGADEPAPARRGALGRLRDALRARRAGAAPSEDAGRRQGPPAEGPRAREGLPRLAGQPEGTSYALELEGLPLPPGAGAYLVESAEGAPEGAAPDIVAYIDSFGRAFSIGSPQEKPPACQPDVQLVPYGRPAACTGYVEASVGKGRTARLAEYEQGGDGLVRLVGARVELGPAASAPLPPLEACAVAFLALWLFPRNEGVSLETLSVKSALERLRTADALEAVDGLLADARAAEAHPLLVPPGVVAYAADCLRAAGLEGVSAQDLAADGDEDPFEGLLGMLEGLEDDGPQEEDAGQGDGGDGGREGAPEEGPAQLPPGVSVARISIPAGGDVMSAVRQALQQAGITGLTVLGPDSLQSGAPSLRLVRTTAYANTFYIAFDRRQVSAEGARKLLEAESVLNRFAIEAAELDRVGAAQTATWDEAAELDAWVVDRIAREAWPYLDGQVRGLERADTSSPGMDVRVSFARGCESLRLPYRLEYEFRLDPVAGELAVDVGCPSADLMPRLAPSQGGPGGGRRRRARAEREGLASRYALHLLAVVAAVAFWAGEPVKAATVSCWRGFGAARGSGFFGSEPTCVASARFERAAFEEALSAPEAREAFSRDPLSFLAPFEHAAALEGGSRLSETDPVASLDEDRFHAQGPDMRPELDERPLDARGSELLAASSVEGLGIYEGARRGVWAEEIGQAYEEGGKEAALAEAKDVHDRTENLLVREACLKLIDGVESGRLDPGSPKALAEALSDIYGLQAGLRHAYRLLQSDPAATRAYLESMVSTADQRGWFRDSPTRRYRYFDSYASRALYAARCEEARDGRELRLAADEYYLCHYRLASLLADSLDHAEEAIAHARRCVELGPSVAAGYLRLARCYFCAFDYTSEIEVLKRLLDIAWNPTDVGMALYWLAYAFCLTDRPEAGMACYQKCVEYDRDLAEPALAEAAEFLRKRGASPRLMSEREARSKLVREGVDLARVERNTAFLMKAAGAAADAGAFALARNLIGSAEESMRDDALPPVIDSLSQ